MESDDLCKFTLISHQDTWHSHLFARVPFILHKPQGKDFVEEIRRNPDTYIIEECRFFKEICKSLYEKKWVLKMNTINSYVLFLLSLNTTIPIF